MLQSHNLKKVITFVSVFLLLFALSVCDVHAKMRAVEDKDLAEIQGAVGITIGLDVYVSAIASANGGWTVRLSDETGSNILLAAMSLRTTTWDAIEINTNVTLDVGTNGSQTWLQLGGLVFPASNDYISSDNISIGGQQVGAFNITGLYIGSNQGLLNLGSNTPWVRLSSHSSGKQGIEGYASMGAYVSQLYFQAGTGTTGLTFTDLYIYGANSTIADGNPSNWGTLYGPAQIGFNGTPFSIDVGSNGSNTLISMSLPMTANIRIKNVTMNGTSWGPIAIDNLILYQNTMNIRNNL